MNKILTSVMLAVTLWSCSSVKHVPEGKYLLDDVRIQVNRDKGCGEEVTESSLVNYLRQTPNHKVIGFMKLQLATYSLSGRDSTKKLNQWLRRLGQTPVIYDSELTERSRQQLELALKNRGYNEAYVSVDTFPRPEKKKIKVTYNVNPGCPQFVRSINYEIPDSAVKAALISSGGSLPIKNGMIFDRNQLENARVEITEQLRKQGYYAFIKDYVTFIADTAKGSKDIDLTMVIKPPYSPDGKQGQPDDKHLKYVFSHVYFVTDARTQFTSPDSTVVLATDTVHYKGITIYYGGDRYLHPSVLEEKCFIDPGSVFTTMAVDRTYEALSQLAILNYVNINIRQVGIENGIGLLDAYIYIDRSKKQSLSFEIEGTNSEGDLGFGTSITYQHRDIDSYGEVFTTKINASYESLSGNFEGLINNRYTELGAEVSLTFPRFEFPFLSKAFKRKVRASSEVNLEFDFQQRPEFTRVIAGAGWQYNWSEKSNRVRRTWDLIDISIVSLPKSTTDFLNTISPLNPLLRYSYEDHFIMRMGYSYFRTNRRTTVGLGSNNKRSTLQRNIFTLRTSVETAGNILYAISSLTGQKKHGGVYKLSGIQYAQYIKGEIDYSRLITIDYRNAFAFRSFLGIGTPYGNSSMIPFEKRFYAGGANGVRGWNVRTLGPGRFPSTNTVTDFINQCGDINFILSAEYRFKMFWVLEGALFADAGNIWTIRNYENQSGGLFEFKDFYKEIAASYGIGIRLDFNYFLLRLDLGMKAHNPAINQKPWPIIHPNFRRDAAFHFSVGYPF